MSNTDHPIIIEPAELQTMLGDSQLRVIDLSIAETYNRFHIPGAVHLPYARIVRPEKPVMALLPEPDTLNALFTSLGIDEHTHVVAYDDNAGSKAARLLWTLDAVGHQNYSLLNGGLHAWATEGYPLERTMPNMAEGDFHCKPNPSACADKDYILDRLDQPKTRILDVRSPGEFNGTDRRARRCGHIPDAVNINWIEFTDPKRAARIKLDDDLNQLLAEHHISSDQEVITHCQSHQRSAFSFVVLKHLGYSNVRGYAGAWSEWGNSDDTPVEE